MVSSKFSPIVAMRVRGKGSVYWTRISSIKTTFCSVRSPCSGSWGTGCGCSSLSAGAPRWRPFQHCVQDTGGHRKPRELTTVWPVPFVLRLSSISTGYQVCIRASIHAYTHTCIHTHTHSGPFSLKPLPGRKYAYIRTVALKNGLCETPQYPIQV